VARRTNLIWRAGALITLLALGTFDRSGLMIAGAATIDELAICHSLCLQTMDGKFRWRLSRGLRAAARIVEQMQALDKVRPESPTWVFELAKARPTSECGGSYAGESCC